MTPQTRLSFVTTGVLLRRLLDDPDLVGVTHVIVDEVHERSVDSDFLLAILKKMLMRPNNKVKVVLMSATMDERVFIDYFTLHNQPPAVLKIPGLTYPVRDIFLGELLDETGYEPKGYLVPEKVKDERKHLIQTLEGSRTLDTDLVAAAVNHAHYNDADLSKAVLVFCSGVMEISKTCTALHKSNRNLHVLALHGSLTPQEQNSIFGKPPLGLRKVIVSTNVAETSITVDDVVFVVDTGKMKEVRYNALSQMSELKETWVSQASARQRRGRAGRVSKGICLKLYSQPLHDSFPAQQLPEIHRTPLEQLLISAMSLALVPNVEYFMEALIQPPPVASVKSGLSALRQLGAVEADRNVLTPLGRHLAQLPMQARLAKMLIFGSCFGCAQEMLIIAAGLTGRTPWMSPQDKRQQANEAKNKFNIAHSDHLALLYAFIQWDSYRGYQSRRQFADQHFLNNNTLRDMNELRKSYRKALEQVGFDAGSSVMDKASQKFDIKAIRLMKACLVSALYPNLVKIRYPEQKYAPVNGGNMEVDPLSKELKFFAIKSHWERESDPHNAEFDTRVFVHPSSVNFHLTSKREKFLMYQEKVNTSKVFVRETSLVPPYGLLLFGASLHVDHGSNKIVVDGLIKVSAQARVGVLVKELRHRLMQLLEEKVKHPGLDIVNHPVIFSCVRLVTGGGLEH